MSVEGGQRNVPASSKGVTFTKRWSWSLNVLFRAFQVIVHAMGDCQICVGSRRCSLMAGIRQWLIVWARVIIRILAVKSDVGIRCASLVWVHLVQPGCLICRLFNTLKRLRTYVFWTPCHGVTARSRQKRRGLIGQCFAILSRCRMRII